MSDVMEIFRKPVDMALREKFEGLINIKKQGFTFLKLFCRKHRNIQSRLFARLDDLLGVEGTEKELGLLIFEMFRDNEELAMKLQEDQIKKLVKLLAKHQYHEIWIALNAIVRIDYFTIKRNQNFAIKYLMQNRQNTIHFFDKGDGEKRIHVMRRGTIAKNGGKVEPGELQTAMYHQFQVRTIASCAEGENRFIESLCQNLLSLDDLFQVICDPDIHMDFKRPYLRFLLWAYLATSGPADSNVLELGYDKRVWDLMSEIGERVKDIGKKNLATLTIDFPMDAPYLFEAAFPFFTHFFERYYIPGYELEKNVPDHVKLTQGYFDIVLDFYRKMRECPSFAAAKDRRRVNFCLQIFIVNQFATDAQIEEYEKVAAIPIKKGDKKKKGEDGAGSDNPSVLRYLEEYSPQLKKSQVKKDFILKLKQSYENDPNTPQYDPESGLPRGLEFQQHLNMFIQFKNGTFKIKTSNIVTLVKGLKIGLDIFQKLGEYEKFVLADVMSRSLHILLAAIATEVLKTDEDLYSERDRQRAERNVNDIRSILNSSGGSFYLLLFYYFFIRKLLTLSFFFSFLSL